MIGRSAIPESIALELRTAYAGEKRTLHVRLEEFARVPRQNYFYELCYCIMTPQSSALQCDKVSRELARRGFLENPFDPEPLLRSFQDGYVRFHRTKARRLLALRTCFPEVLVALDSNEDTKRIRHLLVSLVDGLGMKEASHFLRNIGRTDVTIIDRHIIRNLIRFGVLEEWPTSISTKRYLELERSFEECASALEIPYDALDLLLWSRETGFVLK